MGYKHALLFAGALASASITQSAIEIGYDTGIGGIIDPFTSASEKIFIVPFQFNGSGTYTLNSIALLLDTTGGAQTGLSVGVTNTLPTNNSFSTSMTFSTADAATGIHSVNYSADGSYEIDANTPYYLALSGFNSSLSWKSGVGVPNLVSTSELSPVTAPLLYSDSMDFRLIANASSSGSTSGSSSGSTSGSTSGGNGDKVGNGTSDGDYSGGVGGFSITATAIPETSTIVASMGGIALLVGLVSRSRRKRQQAAE